jgi:hypothetical protein
MKTRFGGHVELPHKGNPSPPATEMLARAASIEASNPVARNLPQVNGSIAHGRGGYSNSHADESRFRGKPTADNLKVWSDRAASNSARCADATRARK